MGPQNQSFKVDHETATVFPHISLGTDFNDPEREVLKREQS